MDDAARGSGALWLGLAGFAATAVAYGPARLGYGLFVPDFREDFGLSTGAAGLIGSGLQAGYLLATALLVARLGAPHPGGRGRDFGRPRHHTRPAKPASGDGS